MKSKQEAWGSYLQWSFQPLDDMPQWHADWNGLGVGVKWKDELADGGARLPSGFQSSPDQDLETFMSPKPVCLENFAWVIAFLQNPTSNKGYMLCLCVCVCVCKISSPLFLFIYFNN